MREARVCGQPLMVGQDVWIWDTKRESNLGDKLAPMWVRPTRLIQQKTRAIWDVQYKGKGLVLHSDMIRPYWAPISD